MNLFHSYNMCCAVGKTDVVAGEFLMYGANQKRDSGCRRCTGGVSASDPYACDNYLIDPLLTKSGTKLTETTNDYQLMNEYFQLNMGYVEKYDSSHSLQVWKF